MLVSGGAGQIGSFVSRFLLSRGDHVVCVDNLSTGEASNVSDLMAVPEFAFLKHDVTEPLPEGYRFDAVYHLASPASPPEYQSIPLETLAVNSHGTWNLLRVAERDGARFLYASTSEVYGDPAVHPQTEDYWGRVNPNGVRSCYDESKRFGEALTASFVRTKRIDARIVRIFNTYGPRSRPSDGRMIPNFVTQALLGEPLTIYGSGKQTRSVCYVSDTVAGIVRSLDTDLPPGTVMNIGNPEERTVLDLAQIIATACGVELDLKWLPLPEDDPTRRCPDISRARELIGWEPKVSLAEGLDMTVAWFRDKLAVATEPH